MQKRFSPQLKSSLKSSAELADSMRETPQEIALSASALRGE